MPRTSRAERSPYGYDPTVVVDTRKLERLRKEAGLSLPGLARVIERDRSWLWRIERGLRNPTPASVELIAEGLGVSPAELLAGDQFAA